MGTGRPPPEQQEPIPSDACLSSLDFFSPIILSFKGKKNQSVCMARKFPLRRLITQSSLLPDTVCLAPASPSHQSAEGEYKRETCITEAMCDLMDYGW